LPGRESRSDGGKLASYEVAGAGGENWIRAEGTMDGADVPSSFQDENWFGAFPDTSCLANFRLFLLGRLFANRRPKIFFQPGEGAFKGVVVLPVRELREPLSTMPNRLPPSLVGSRRIHKTARHSSWIRLLTAEA